MKAILFFVMLTISCGITAKPVTKEFNSYVEGALEVYSQFKRPSKAESERFYTFVQEKWNETSCVKNCSDVGYNVAKQYAKEKRVEIKHNNSLQPK